jgi:hypothetical protein
MSPKHLNTASFSLLAFAATVLFLGWAIDTADGARWITHDAKGRKAVFEVPEDHPALKATGKKAKLWARTAFFMEFERRLAKKLNDKSWQAKAREDTTEETCEEETTTTTPSPTTTTTTTTTTPP